MSQNADVRCPVCQQRQSCVKDTRGKKAGDSIWRRRACLACGVRFTTMEQVAPLTEDDAFRILEQATAMLLKIRSRNAA